MDSAVGRLYLAKELRRLCSRLSQLISASFSPNTIEKQWRRAQLFAHNCSEPDLLGGAFRLPTQKITSIAVYRSQLDEIASFVHS